MVHAWMSNGASAIESWPVYVGERMYCYHTCGPIYTVYVMAHI